MTEWGVRHQETKKIFPMASRQLAEHWLRTRSRRSGELLHPDFELVRREVTPWETVA